MKLRSIVRSQVTRRLVVRAPAAVVVSLSVLAATVPAAEPIDFNRDIRPILSSKCFKCHGPDEAVREADLRLDRADGATRDRDGVRAIVPKHPEASELVARITSADADLRMPPPDSGLSLSESQVELLTRWIRDGAEYRTHWSFVRPEQPKPPAVDDPRVQSAIDRFVARRLEREGLRSAPDADRYTLVRRVCLDLIGLPPTIEDADRFVGDDSPDAWERLVDRLLASPHYGERWARRWLDLARYADTNGYEKDRPRSIWPYRDWVIDAINADKPFDEFTIEQIAGDMLPGATLRQRIATGFHRNTMLNEEGGIDPLEFRFYAMTDRVATTGTVWLGMTIGCAQCHTHKYDPVTHRDYYGLMAFLNNSDEPEIVVPQPATARRRTALAGRIAKLEADLASKFPGDVEAAFASWLAEQRKQTADWRVLRPTSANSGLPKLDILGDESILASGDQTKLDVYTVTFAADAGLITAIRLEALPDPSLPKNGPGRAYYEGPKGDFFLSELTLSADGQPVTFREASHSYAKNGIGSGRVAAELALDGVAHSGWSADKGQGKSHHAVFVAEQPIAGGRPLTLKLVFDRHYPAGLGRFRVSATSDPRTIKARAMPLDIESMLTLPDRSLTVEDRRRLRDYFLSVAPELKAARKEIDKLKGQLPDHPTTLVMAERPSDNPRLMHRHHRGEFLQPKERVGPSLPDVLPPIPDGVPRSRLSFARWLVDPGNPLTGRVTVNRHWAAFFGTGIVRTTEDFGFQGEPPSHPDLLDWLAVEFVRRGWSVKSLHRTIVGSHTYRQSSRTDSELLSLDPNNRLLARGPRFRVDAEVVRDLALAASDRLSDRMKGPSVFPPQPESVSRDSISFGRFQWTLSDGEDRYRRGLYTYSKRTNPYAMFLTFDGPSGEQCAARRDKSNTPLQALTLLNDAVFMQAARDLGRTIATSGGSDEDRLRLLFRRCLTRPPDEFETETLLMFFSSQRRRLKNGEIKAAEINSVGKNADHERAAWTLVARTLLNLDEMITKR